MKHGTVGGYTNNGCRCPECRAAQRTYAAQRRALRRQESTPENVHGTENGYTNYGCRCVPCRTAHAATARHARTTRAALEAPDRVKTVDALDALEPGTLIFDYGLQIAMKMPWGRWAYIGEPGDMEAERVPLPVRVVPY